MVVVAAVAAAVAAVAAGATATIGRWQLIRCATVTRDAVHQHVVVSVVAVAVVVAIGIAEEARQLDLVGGGGDGAITLPVHTRSSTGW